MSGFGMIGEDGDSEEEVVAPSPVTKKNRNNGNSNNGGMRTFAPDQQSQRSMGSTSMYPPREASEYDNVPTNGQGFAASSRKKPPPSRRPEPQQRETPLRMPQSNRRNNQPVSRGYDGDEVDPTSFFPDEVNQSKRPVEPVPRPKTQRKPKPEQTSSRRREDYPKDESDQGSDSEIESIVPKVSEEQKQKMKLSRSTYNLEKKVTALTVELGSLQSAMNNALTSMQHNVDNLVKKIKKLESQLKKSKETEEESRLDVTNNIQSTLQELRDNMQWFWGRVENSSVGYVEAYQFPPDSQEKGEVITFPTGSWLKLHYPMKVGPDHNGKEFVWIPTDLINSKNASIKMYWVKAFDKGKKQNLLTYYTFKSPSPEVVDTKDDTPMKSSKDKKEVGKTVKERNKLEKEAKKEEKVEKDSTKDSKTEKTIENSETEDD